MKKKICLPLSLDISCANNRPRTTAAITERMPNQENLKKNGIGEIELSQSHTHNTSRLSGT